MEKGRLFANAIMTSVHVVVNAAILFVLYKFALSILGVERLGVWSLVLATASAGTLLQLGFTTSVIKFVAKYLALNDKLTVARIIETSVISIGLFIGVLLLCLYPLGKVVLEHLIAGEKLIEAVVVLPYALLALWLFIISYVYQSGLDGYQAIVSRKLILIVAGMVQFTVAYFLMQQDGVLGLAYAQIAQSLVILFGSGFLLKRRLPILNIIPRRWSRKVFKEMFRYSTSLQAMSICEMIVDPITKILITKFGGLAMTGYYDLASRMGYQIRALVVIANEVLVPAVATLVETNRNAIRQVYSDAYSLNLFISVPLFSLAVVSMPLISRLWLGSYEVIFVEFSSVIAFGWFFNAISTPAIVVQIGIARLRWVILASITVAVLTLVLGTALGFFYGGGSVIWAWAISRMISALMVIVPYHLENKIPLRSLIATEHFGLFAGAAVVLYVYTEAYFANLSLNLQPTKLALVVAAIGLVIVGLSAWFDPVRKRLASYAASVWSNWRRLAEPPT